MAGRLVLREKIKLNTLILFSVMLVVIFSLIPVFSSLTNFVMISNTGQIALAPDVVAASGSARDIQEAVDQVTAVGGIGNVLIPEGTFNFVEVGEPWMTVNVPAGINIYGAPTQRDADDQVIDWETVLIMPYEAPTISAFFQFKGEQDPNEFSRFSDIKLVGYREIDPNSITMYQGVRIVDMIDFRVDHSYFRNLAHRGVQVEIGAYGNQGRKETGRLSIRGVIDHNKFVNSHGIPSPWGNHTMEYAVGMGRGVYCEEWEDDISKVLGQYTSYTIFIEDNYFSLWRHVTASNNGIHYVFRYNTVEDNSASPNIDAHGWALIDEEGRVRVGTRAMEVYENRFINSTGTTAVLLWRGGGGVAFNNTVIGDNYIRFAFLQQEAADEVQKCQIQDLWVWNNVLPEGCTEIYAYWGGNNPIIEGTHYFRYVPHTFQYTPYPYPHPLTLEITP